MHWLNAALAFAITMLILSMVVSTLVETLHRFLRLRADGLRIMLGKLFDDVVAPHFAFAQDETDSIKTQQSKTMARDDFVTYMVRNRAQSTTVLDFILHAESLNKLDVQQFMTRLGDSQYGDALRRAMNRVGTDLADEVLRHVAQQFEAFGVEAGEYFQRRARLLSVLVALLLAWYGNVNPYDLLRTYLTDDKVTAGVIALQQEVEQRYKETAETLGVRTKRLANKVADKPGVIPTGPEADDLKRDLEQVTKVTNQSIDELRTLGVPLGWTPTRLGEINFERRGCLNWPWPSAWNAKSVTAVMWMLIGGLLIGLGGPFWFDAVRSLSSVRSLLSPTPPASADPATTPSPAANAAVTQFKTAAIGRDAATGQGAFHDVDDEPAVG